MYASFFDELHKIAAARSRMVVAQPRKGRRSMSVSTLLKKEKNGSLYKKAELIDWKGELLTEREVGHRLVERIKKAAGKHGKNSAGFDLQGKTSFQGLPIAIENRKGSVREGKNDDGSRWRTKFRLPYGYLENTKGADDEEVDVYVGPKKDADTAFIVDQKKEDGSYDENTVMLGFRSKADAKKGILQHYDKPKLIGAVRPMAMEKLKGLIAAKKKLTKIGNVAPMSAFPKHSGEAERVSGKRRPGDVPSLGEAPSRAKTETRQTNSSVTPVVSTSAERS